MSTMILAMILAISPIDTHFTQTASMVDQRQTHETAKEWLQDHLTQAGAIVVFIEPPLRDIVEPVSDSHMKTFPLDAATFSWVRTQGVSNSLQKSIQI